MSNWFSKLHKIAYEVTEQIQYLNSGGCGVFAYLVGICLPPELNVKVRVHKGWSWDEEPDVELNSLQPEDVNSPHSWNRCGVHFRHLVLQLEIKGETYYYDSDGLRDSIDLSDIYLGYLPLEILGKLVSSGSGWNDEFDREQIPLLKEIIFKEMMKKNNESPCNIPLEPLSYWCSKNNTVMQLT